MDEPIVATESGRAAAHDGPASHLPPSGRVERVEAAPNRAALAVLAQIRERQQGRRETDPSRTQDLIREARAGGIPPGRRLGSPPTLLAEDFV